MVKTNGEKVKTPIE